MIEDYKYTVSFTVPQHFGQSLVCGYNNWKIFSGEIKETF